MKIIREKNFAHYFLVVADITRKARRSCGRGSAAASIVSYALGITHVDPIRHRLFFERFLNPGRMDPPDIDVDFAWDERDQVIDYVFSRYGNRPGRHGGQPQHLRGPVRRPGGGQGLRAHRRQRSAG